MFVVRSDYFEVFVSGILYILSSIILPFRTLRFLATLDIVQGALSRKLKLCLGIGPKELCSFLERTLKEDKDICVNRRTRRDQWEPQKRKPWR